MTVETQFDPALVVMLDTEDNDWWLAQALVARSNSRLKKTSRNSSRPVVARG